MRERERAGQGGDHQCEGASQELQRDPEPRLCLPPTIPAKFDRPRDPDDEASEHPAQAKVGGQTGASAEAVPIGVKL